MLYDLMKEELKITDDFEIIPMAEGMTRDELASVSKILGKLIENKDECALELIDKAGYEAALTINTLAKNLNFEGKVLASYSGGVFNLGEALIVKIKQYLDSNIDLVKPYADPTQGALILAKKFFQENK